ncbi:MULTISPECIES: hypothetical protein [Micromonospora]|uniref:hypothetical protein n=1 Tax=Micromonospora TaxID=1873 RepID=UPI0011CEAE13|nr:MULTISPECIES: hypothetical protein [Micromonospora]NES14755.1 hypothetical protein [Micromonospora sp. PPF5-17B]NES39291.1 hypothetical protein [Micromonospora solifontis]NES56199.1 hypothetical protein [Micromonospora sp. PPF5-6]
MTTIHALATALADAFLAGDGWRRANLVDQGGLVLGIRRRWLRAVADAVLAAYPRPPTDRPRELATFLSTLDPLRAAVATAHQHQRPIVIHTRPVTPTRTVRRPWHTPIIDTVGDLAAMLDLSIEHLDWYADRRAMNRRATTHRLHHYHYRWTEGGRLIEAPKSRLRALQRRLLTEVLGPIPPPTASYPAAPHTPSPPPTPHSRSSSGSTCSPSSPTSPPPASTACSAPPATPNQSPTPSPDSAPPAPRTPSCAAHPPTYRSGRRGSPPCAPATCPSAASGRLAVDPCSVRARIAVLELVLGLDQRASVTGTRDAGSTTTSETASASRASVPAETG